MLLGVVAAIGVVGKGIWKLLPPSAPAPTLHTSSVFDTGKWVLLGLLSLVLIGLYNR